MGDCSPPCRSLRGSSSRAENSTPSSRRRRKKSGSREKDLQSLKERLTRTTRRCKPCSSKCENTSRRSCAHQGWTTQNRRATRPTKSSTNDAGSTSRKKENKERHS